jgi:cytochrome c oxidase subunit II
MISKLRFFPPSASSVSGPYDLFFALMVVLCGAVGIAIAIFLIYSVIRYHRKTEEELPPQIHDYIPAEVAWIVIPLILFMGMYAWGAKLYFDVERPPDNALSMYVVGKQWMWKVQHPEGQREINELHIPVGRPVKLTMTSQDVVHSFFIPAFRTKQDVLPGRYTLTWFEATKPGKYHLFCSEYCGTKHSGMIGWVYAMNPHDYQLWLQDGAAEGSLASTGEKLFHQYGCANCHHFSGHGRAPNLQDLYGRTVALSGGGAVIADETYIRESILQPRSKIVEGFQTIMPTFEGLLSEEQVIQLISYIKSLGPPPGAVLPSSSGAAPREYGTQPGIGAPGATSNAGSQPEIR